MEQYALGKRVCLSWHLDTELGVHVVGVHYTADVTVVG